MSMVNKMHFSLILESYKKQEPIDNEQLKDMLNMCSIAEDISNDNLLSSITNENIINDSGDGYTIGGVEYTIDSLNEYNKLLYSIEKKNDDHIIIKHNKSGWFFKINIKKSCPVWYDYVSEDFERVILMYLKQIPMSFDDLKDFANYSEFRDTIYSTDNYIYVLSDFCETINVLDNAKVNMPYKYSGAGLSVNETTYTIDGIIYKFNDLKKYHANIYDRVKVIESKDCEGKITKRSIVKHNESGRYLENLVGFYVDDEQRKKWYEVKPKTKKSYKFVGEESKKYSSILRNFLKQIPLSFDDTIILLNKLEVFSYVYKGGNFIYDEIKSDLRYRNIEIDNFSYHETDGYYILDDVKYTLNSLDVYSECMYTIHESYEKDSEYEDIEYCVISHDATGRYIKFESETNSYDGNGFESSVWFEVKKESVDVIEFESV